jgi:hypothetical protein
MKHLWGLISLVCLISSCTLSSRYHSSGFTVQWNQRGTHWLRGNTEANNSNRESGVKSFSPSGKIAANPSNNFSATSTCKTAREQTGNSKPFRVDDYSNKNSKADNGLRVFTASADSSKPKKSLAAMEAQLANTQQKIRNNFIGFAALLSPLIVTGGRQDSKFVRGWNFTFLALAFIALVFALAYVFIYVFRWIRFTVARHTRKNPT